MTSLRDDFAAIRKRSVRRPVNFIDLQVLLTNLALKTIACKDICTYLRKNIKRQTLQLGGGEVNPAQQAYAKLIGMLRIYKRLTNSSISISNQDQ